MSLISLLSDFGLRDPYLAAMKAVILSINPEIKIVDITHRVEKFNILMGSYFLASVVPYFPRGSIHLVVVDPGVGTKRRAIIVKTNRSLYVGPDNGVLMLASQKEKILSVYHIENSKYMLSRISKTFHGRDIFAPVAAYLSLGVNTSELGSEIEDYFIPDYSKTRVRNMEVIGKIIHIDDFGNIISNISPKDLDEIDIKPGNSINITIGNKRLILDFLLTYGNIPIGKPLALIGSGNYLEIAINQGNAAKIFKKKIGDLFTVTKNPKV